MASDSEIVIVMGYPAAGKTTLMEDFAGYERLNRDLVGGTLSEIAAELDRRIKSGKKKFVLDNTYGTRASRQEVIAVGLKSKIPVRCCWLQTSIEDAQVNATQRMLSKYGKVLGPIEFADKRDPNLYGPVVLFTYKNHFEPPDLSEGFSKVDQIAFKRRSNPAYKGKALIVDFDGTLRDTPEGAKHDYPTKIEEVQIMPGRSAVLKKYKAQGYRLLGASNQSGIAKGELTDADARACFEQTNKLLGVDIEYSYCPHTIGGKGIECYCRKPMPGLLIQFIEKYKLDRAETIFVGDQTTDKTCAARAGVKYVDQKDFFK